MQSGGHFQANATLCKCVAYSGFGHSVRGLRSPYMEIFFPIVTGQGQTIICSFALGYVTKDGL